MARLFKCSPFLRFNTSYSTFEYINQLITEKHLKFPLKINVWFPIIFSQQKMPMAIYTSLLHKFYVLLTVHPCIIL